MNVMWIYASLLLLSTVLVLYDLYVLVASLVAGA